MSMVKSLYRDYGSASGGLTDRFVIDIPEWQIADEGITALWGPSGSGKTSVFRLLLGLEKCASLSWVFKGQDLAQLPTPKRRLGVVFQSYELFSHLSAWRNIQFAAEARGRHRFKKTSREISDKEYRKKLNKWSDKKFDKKSDKNYRRKSDENLEEESSKSVNKNADEFSVEALMHRLNLKDCANTPAKYLSGGEKQRVALARALVGQPQFLFLDEPFSALDAHLKETARQLVKEVISALKIPTLLISHDEADVKSLAHTVVRIEAGRLQKGT